MAEEQFVSPDELSDFQMPLPHVGQTVLWYPLGRVDPRHVRAAIVTAVRNGSVSVWQVGAYARDGVKHVSDPRLRMNQEQRADGAWDFTPADIRMSRFLDQLERMESSQQNLDAVTRDSPNRGAAMSQLWTLRRKCQEMGHAGWQTLSKTDAEEFLAERVG